MGYNGAMNYLLPAVTVAILLTTALHVFADLLNLRRARHARRPEEFRELLSEEEFARAKEYLSVTTRLRTLQTTLWTAASLGFVWGGGLGWIDAEAGRLGLGWLGRALVFFGALAALSGIFSLPFSWYSTFRVEQRFGFNRSTQWTFWTDGLKGLAVGIVIGAPVLAAVLWLFSAAGSLAWLWAWGFTAAVQLLLGFVAPVLLLPIFYKLSPLPEGELKNAIEAYAKRVGFQLEGIYTMDGSRRSSKANAFFTGLGRFRRIVLFDTLVEKHTVPELVAVLAHEVGHFKRGHVPKMLGVSLLSSLALFYALSWAIALPAASIAFGFAEHSLHAGLTVAFWVYSPLSTLMEVLVQGLSRKHEFEADAFAAETTGEAHSLAEGLKRLSAGHLANLDPHPLKVFLEYSHPPVLQRVRALGK